MKQRLLALLLALVLMAGLTLTGCGHRKDPPADDPAASQGEPADPNGEGGEDSETPTDGDGDSDAEPPDGDTGYLSWTTAEFSASSEAEQINATLAYLIYVYEGLGTTYTEDELRRADDALTEVAATLGGALATSPTLTLRAIADQAVILMAAQ